MDSERMLQRANGRNGIVRSWLSMSLYSLLSPSAGNNCSNSGVISLFLSVRTPSSALRDYAFCLFPERSLRYRLLELCTKEP